jgi:hypothetical protein
MRTSRSQRVAIFMILSGFGFEVAMGTSGCNGSHLLATGCSAEVMSPGFRDLKQRRREASASQQRNHQKFI